MHVHSTSEAGGSVFCDLAKSNMAPWQVPDDCKPREGNSSDVWAGSWSNDELVGYLAENGHAVVSNERGPFGPGRLELSERRLDGSATTNLRESERHARPGLLFLTTLHDAPDRLLSAYWSHQEEEATERPTFDQWMKNATHSSAGGHGVGTEDALRSDATRMNHIAWRFSGGALPPRASPERSEEWKPSFEAAVRALSQFDLVLPADLMDRDEGRRALSRMLGWDRFDVDGRKTTATAGPAPLRNSSARVYFEEEEYRALWEDNWLDNILCLWSRAVFLARLHCEDDPNRRLARPPYPGVPAKVPEEGEHKLRGARAAADPSAPRVLLYVTTHVSIQHQWYLRNCWGEVFRHSALLRGSDVMVYANPPVAERGRALGVLWRAFPEQQLTVHLESGNETGSAEDRNNGAMAALWYAIERNLFDGYDWIIRLNPDVIVRDDSFLVDSILHDPAASALLIDCMKHTKDYRNRTQIHTDFFALRRELLGRRIRINHPNDNPELQFTDYLRGAGGNTPPNIKGLRWIPGADHEGGDCRAGAGKPLNMTPITHVHYLNETDGKYLNVVFIKEGTCPIPFAGGSQPEEEDKDDDDDAGDSRAMAVRLDRIVGAARTQ